MTFGKLLGLGLIVAVVAAILKIIFINALNFEAIGIQIVFWLLMIVLGIAAVRRLAVLNYLETFLVMLLWFVAILIVDALFTQHVVGSVLWRHYAAWLGDVGIWFGIFFFHKKRHVEIRKEMAKK